MIIVISKEVRNLSNIVAARIRFARSLANARDDDEATGFTGNPVFGQINHMGNNYGE